MKKTTLLPFLFLLFVSLPLSSFAISPLYSPLPALSVRNLAVIVNDEDPESIEVARYYQQRRQIPEANILHVHFKPGIKVLPVDQFQKIKKHLDDITPEHIQAYALTWTLPFRVGCMSITTAFAAGYDEKFCARGCKATRLSPYFNSQSAKPYTDFKWRPTMALAGHNTKEVKALIDRGVASDYNHPIGTAYLLTTSDKARSTRSRLYPGIAKFFGGLWPISILKQDYIENKLDVMFYFTGKTHIPKIETNFYFPGAIADHLTSSGGVLSGSKQMSILKWIEAGVTGSYGAVVEPCNFIQKFPNPGIVMLNYLRGSTLIEAYWKSVAWPGQGIFIGEPLAKPFAYPTVLEK